MIPGNVPQKPPFQKPALIEPPVIPIDMGNDETASPLQLDLFPKKKKIDRNLGDSYWDQPTPKPAGKSKKNDQRTTTLVR